MPASPQDNCARPSALPSAGPSTGCGGWRREYERRRVCTATGLKGKPSSAEFASALEECCRSLARQVAIDGEGATKLIEVRVRGAPDERSAAQVARTVAGSPLVKTAVYGEDPNWGRVIAAAGRAGVASTPTRSPSG